MLNWATEDLSPQDFIFLENKGCVIDLCYSIASSQNDVQEIPGFSGYFCSVGKVHNW